MKATGIIVKYNPLHNGHVYHINQTKERSKTDCLIAVMSSHFTQRGEPTLIDKFTRTGFALNNGVDMVIELPFVFGVQNADIFAKASVNILDILKVKDIYFGSETNDISSLEKIISLLESDAYQEMLKENLNQGFSYPTSSNKAIQDLAKNDFYDKPNAILGIQYLKAAKDLNSNINLYPIQRIKTGYYEDIKGGSTVQSATAIRKLLFNKQPISEYVPFDVNQSLSSRKLVSYNDFIEPLKYILQSKTSSELANIFNMKEGFENRLLKVRDFTDIEDLISQIISKRYTNSFIKRTLTHTICNTSADSIKSFNIPYIRILGMNEKGRTYLNQVKNDIDIPIITNVKEGIHPYLDIELRVSKIYSLASDKDTFKMEFNPKLNLRFD